MFNERLIHLDLKGAPPRVEYLEAVFPVMKQWGATGLCVEWEDMLPFEGRFRGIRSPDAYGPDDLKRIFAAAEAAGLSVVPLVQTFGHLEFVLKHESFAEFREKQDDLMNLCPLHEGALELIRELIDQVIGLNPGIKAIHMGGDEVWTLGSCPACAAFAAEHGKAALYLKHALPLLAHVRERGLRSLIWDDMFRSWPVEALASIRELAEPVVWLYGPDIEPRLPEDMRKRYAQAELTLWGASAFKGADGPEIIWPRFDNRALNHASWARAARKTDFRGLILTGWSRYSHFCALSDTLPATLPSLALCLAVLDREELTDELRRQTFESLGLGDMPCMHKSTEDIASIPTGNFPGADAFRLIGKLQGARQLVEKSREYVRVHSPKRNGGRWNRYDISKVAEDVRRAAEIAGEVGPEIEQALQPILFQSDVHEFMAAKVDTILAEAAAIGEEMDRLLAEHDDRGRE